jgi:hypothetical protein
MQSEERIQGPQQQGHPASQNIALLTRKERDWLLGKIDLSKSYEYRLKSSIKKKLQAFINLELPLLIKNNLISHYEPESPGAGFGDGIIFDYNPNLGKAPQKYLCSPNTNFLSVENYL